MTPYWTQVIAEAKERRRVGLVGFEEEHRSRACAWFTCACGRQDPLVPRLHGVPRDRSLRALGHDFFYAVRADEPDWAERVLAKIERRADVVIREAMSEATS